MHRDVNKAYVFLFAFLEGACRVLFFGRGHVERSERTIIWRDVQKWAYWANVERFVCYVCLTSGIHF